MALYISGIIFIIVYFTIDDTFDFFYIGPVFVLSELQCPIMFQVCKCVQHIEMNIFIYNMLYMNFTYSMLNLQDSGLEVN